MRGLVEAALLLASATVAAARPLDPGPGMQKLMRRHKSQTLAQVLIHPDLYRLCADCLCDAQHPEPRPCTST